VSPKEWASQKEEVLVTAVSVLAALVTAVSVLAASEG